MGGPAPSSESRLRRRASAQFVTPPPQRWGSTVPVRRVPEPSRPASRRPSESGDIDDPSDLKQPADLQPNPSHRLPATRHRDFLRCCLAYLDYTPATFADGCPVPDGMGLRPAPLNEHFSSAVAGSVGPTREIAAAMRVCVLTFADRRTPFREYRIDDRLFSVHDGAPIAAFRSGLWATEPGFYPTADDITHAFSVYGLVHGLPSWGHDRFHRGVDALSAAQFYDILVIFMRLLSATVTYDNADHPVFDIDKNCSFVHGLQHLSTLCQDTRISQDWDHPDIPLHRRSYSAFFFRRLHDWCAIFSRWTRRCPSCARATFHLPDHDTDDWILATGSRGGDPSLHDAITDWYTSTDLISDLYRRPSLLLADWPSDFPFHLRSLLSAPTHIPAHVPAPLAQRFVPPPRRAPGPPFAPPVVPAAIQPVIADPPQPKPRAGKPPTVSAVVPLFRFHPAFDLRPYKHIGILLRAQPPVVTGKIELPAPIRLAGRTSAHVCYEFTMAGRTCGLGHRCQRLHLDLNDPELLALQPPSWFKPIKTYLMDNSTVFEPTAALLASPLWLQ